jgi:hypothetical protein
MILEKAFHREGRQGRKGKQSASLVINITKAYGYWWPSLVLGYESPITNPQSLTTKWFQTGRFGYFLYWFQYIP